jgi:hypothetical protein
MEPTASSKHLCMWKGTGQSDLSPVPCSSSSWLVSLWAVREGLHLSFGSTGSYNLYTFENQWG